MSTFQRMLCRKDNITCPECFSKILERQKYEERKAEEVKQQNILNEKINRLNRGESTIVLCRLATLANAALNLKVKVIEQRTGDMITNNIRNGEAVEVTVDGGSEYIIVAKISGWKESKPLSVFVDRSENVYVSITSKSSGNALGLLAYKALNENMVFCDVIKREFIENGKLKTVERSK